MQRKGKHISKATLDDLMDRNLAALVTVVKAPIAVNGHFWVLAVDALGIPLVLQLPDDESDNPADKLVRGLNQ